MLEETKSLDAASMRIIHSGKVLADADTFGSVGVKEGDFLVYMSKPKAAVRPRCVCLDVCAYVFLCFCLERGGGGCVCFRVTLPASRCCADSDCLPRAACNRAVLCAASVWE